MEPMSPNNADGAVWTIHLFGRLRIAGRGLVLDQFYTKRATYLLARLALSHRWALTRAEAADFLWPDDFFDATRLRLRQELVRLRRGLGEARNILESDSEWVRLVEHDIESDTRTFTKLFEQSRSEPDPAVRETQCRDALNIASDDFLQGYNEPWIDLERNRLDEMRYLLLVDLADLEARRGDHQNALGTARKALEADPYREEGHLMVMQELGNLGYVADAIGQYQTLKNLLRDEFSEKPSNKADMLASTLQQSLASQKPAPRSMGAGLVYTVPAPTEPTYGRDDLIEHLYRLFTPGEQANRIVTLTGPGGIGKTSIAVQVAMRLQDPYYGHVGWVPLADTDDPSIIPFVIASSLGIEVGANADPLERVGTLINRQPVVLVFDNFEQLLPTGGDSVRALLSACPKLRVLVTSRVPMKLTGETLIAVGPLPIPSEGDSVDQPSMRVFLDTLLAEQVVQEPTASELSVYREIVARLEGIPLALQLASGRLRTVTAVDLKNQLDKRLDIVNPRRDAPTRHRTLRSAIEGSFQALEPGLQKIMGQLSVFRGGWNQAAAATLCGLEDPLPSMERLYDYSLIQVDREDKGLRFRMLETIRDFVQDAIPSGDLKAAHLKHADWIIELGRPERWRNLDAIEVEHFKLLDLEVDNLREAARYCLENDLDRAIRIGVAYGNYWSNRSLIKEALKFYSRIFELADPESDEPDLARASFRQMQLLYISHAYASSDEGMAVATRTATLCKRAGLEAELALCQMVQARTYAGDIERGIELIEASEKRLKELGETTDLATAIQSRATQQYYQGDLKGALQAMEEAASLLGGSVAPFHQVQTSMMLAFMYFEVGDVANAKIQAYKALGLADSYGLTQFVPMIQEVCGKVAQSEGDLDAAEEWYRVSASNWDFFGSVYQHADLLHSLARVLIQKGEPAEALPLLASATSIWNSKGMTSVTPCCLVSAAKAYLQMGRPQIAGRLLGAYKGLTEPTRDSELPTEVTYVDSITHDLESALGVDVLAKIFASAPNQEEALKEAFSSVLQ